MEIFIRNSICKVSYTVTEQLIYKVPVIHFKIHTRITKNLKIGSGNGKNIFLTVLLQTFPQGFCALSSYWQDSMPISTAPLGYSSTSQRVRVNSFWIITIMIYSFTT